MPRHHTWIIWNSLEHPHLQHDCFWLVSHVWVKNIVLHKYYLLCMQINIVVNRPKNWDELKARYNFIAHIETQVQKMKKFDITKFEMVSIVQHKLHWCLLTWNLMFQNFWKIGILSNVFPRTLLPYLLWNEVWNDGHHWQRSPNWREVGPIEIWEWSWIIGT